MTTVMNTGMPLTEIVGKKRLVVPLRLVNRNRKIIAASSGQLSHESESYVEYLVEKNYPRWDGAVELGFSRLIARNYNPEQYNQIVSFIEGSPPQSLMSRIDFTVYPLVDGGKEHVFSSDSCALTDALSLTCSVHLHQLEERMIENDMTKNGNVTYFAQFLISHSSRLLPSSFHFKGAIPSFLSLYVSRDQYTELVHARRNQTDAYGRIEMEFFSPFSDMDI